MFNRIRYVLQGTTLLPIFFLVFALVQAEALQAQPNNKVLAVTPPIASWKATPQGNKGAGVFSLSGADGDTSFVTQDGVGAISIPPGTTSPPQYLYFSVDRSVAQKVRTAPIFISVDYYDRAIGASLKMDYDSSVGDGVNGCYRPADESIGIIGMGTKTWKTAIFVLSVPGFAGRQNLGADFRLHGGNTIIREIRMSVSRPAEWEKVARVPDVQSIKPLVKIGEGGQLIVGGFDTTTSVEMADTQINALQTALPILKSVGATSHEAYVVWAVCEPEPGKFDWSVYDRYVALYKKNNLKWVPFLICGSPYSIPDWFYKKAGSQGYVCLEHGQESDVQSLWNPEMRRHAARFIQAFCERYRDSGVIETILLGVSGNYGEVIFPVSGNDWTAGRHGDYHSHPGYWAGDAFAVKDFQGWLRKKYGTTAKLNAAWKQTIATFEDVKPFQRDKAPNDRAWLDFTNWYIGSMTDYARFWMQETRKNFKGDIQLCTGGHSTPEFGSDFGEQCRVAGEFGGGVHITNESSDYATNYSLTRWVASAGRQYKSHYAFEPASYVSPEGVVSRIYNATASGAVGLHYYYDNLFSSTPSTDNFVRQGNQFKQHQPVVEVAVYYPQTYIQLRGNLDSSRFLPKAIQLRKQLDFDYMSDGQIRDGGLKSVKALVLMEGDVAEAATLNSIQQWVRGGGVLIYPSDIGRMHSVEGDEDVQKSLLDAGANTGRGRVVRFEGQAASDEFQSFLGRTLQNAPELSAGTRAMLAAGGQSDGVFATLIEGNQLLLFNSSNKEARRGGTTPVVLPPHSIVSQPLAAKLAAKEGAQP